MSVGISVPVLMFVDGCPGQCILTYCATILDVFHSHFVMRPAEPPETFTVFRAQDRGPHMRRSANTIKNADSRWTFVSKPKHCSANTCIFGIGIGTVPFDV